MIWDCDIVAFIPYDHNAFNRLSFYHNSRMNVPRILFCLVVDVRVCWLRFRFGSHQIKNTRCQLILAFRIKHSSVFSNVQNTNSLESSRRKWMRCIHGNWWGVKNRQTPNPILIDSGFLLGIWSQLAWNQMWHDWMGWSMPGLKCNRFRKLLNISLHVYMLFNFFCHCYFWYGPFASTTLWQLYYIYLLAATATFGKLIVSIFWNFVDK